MSGGASGTDCPLASRLHPVCNGQRLTPLANGSACVDVDMPAPIELPSIRQPIEALDISPLRGTRKAQHRWAFAFSGECTGLG